MPGPIDSLFLELGIDTSKFSKDQQRAIAKIQQFEAEVKRSAGKARGGVQTVGEAFRDLAKDSRVGASAAGIENLATKFKNLGISMKVSGGVGAPLGSMALGLGRLLSPAALGAAAIGLVGAEVWDFNKKMTDANATIYRNAQLSNMSAKNLWAWGEAAKTVGGTPQELQAGIAGLQTVIAGQMIGVGSAMPQLTGLARLSTYGARWNQRTGVDIESLFGATYKMGQQQGWARTKALVSGYGLMNDTEFNLAMRGPAGFADYRKAQKAAPRSLETILEESVKAQAALGERQIAADAIAEKAYGALQKPMEDVVGWLTKIYDVLNTSLGFISKLVKFIVPPVKEMAKDVLNATGIPGALKGVTGAWKATSGAVSGMKKLMGLGVSPVQAAAMIGSQMQESSMDPRAGIGTGHVGLEQWDKTRQAAFFKKFGYRMGSKGGEAEFTDQEKFAVDELLNTHRAAAAAMNKSKSLLGKTLAFMQLDEAPGDDSFAKRLAYAMAALAAVTARTAAVQNNSTSDTKIGDVHIHTPATDPKGHADAFRKAVTSPLADPVAQGTMSLATRGMVQ
jgi:hypothetical protein